MEKENATGYADDTTSYANGDSVVTFLEDIKTKGNIFIWKDSF